MRAEYEGRLYDQLVAEVVPSNYSVGDGSPSERSPNHTKGRDGDVFQWSDQLAKWGFNPAAAGSCILREE